MATTSSSTACSACGRLDPWRALGRPISYALLLPDVTVARRRAADRGEHPLKDLDVVDQMHAAFVAHLDGYERHVIDSTTMDAGGDRRGDRRRLDAGELLLRDGATTASTDRRLASDWTIEASEVGRLGRSLR